MKKSLVALAIASLFSSSVSAITLYDNEGSKVDLKGQFRIVASNERSKSKGQTTQKHTNLVNNGTRVQIDVKHNISDDLYATGYWEGRMGDDNLADQWGNLKTWYANVGLGSKQYGEMKFGYMATIGDWIGQSGMDRAFATGSSFWFINGGNILTKWGKSVVRYDYKGIDGLLLSVNYNFANERTEAGEVKQGKVKGGLGAGAIYNINLADNRKAVLAAGYSRDSYATTDEQNPTPKPQAEIQRDGVLISGKYIVDNLTLAADYGYAVRKQWNGFAIKQYYAIVGAKYKFDKLGVYGNYAYSRVKAEEEGVKEGKVHRYMLGTDYQFTKQVLAYVEGRLDRATNGKQEKQTDKVVGVGMRLYW